MNGHNIKILFWCGFMVAGCMETPSTRGDASLSDLTGDAPLTDQGLMKADGKAGCAWKRLNIPEEVGEMDVMAVWGTSETNIYFVGLGSVNSMNQGHVLQFDGKNWKDLALPTIAQPDYLRLNSIWGFGPSDLFVSEAERWLRFDGTQWTLHTYPLKGIGDLWGSSATNMFAAGGDCRLMRFDGTKWTQATNLPAGLENNTWGGVWGTSATNVFAVGEAIVHFDGSKWTEATGLPPHGYLSDIWGSDEKNLFAVGQRGSILHFNGSTWKAMNSNLDTSINLSGVWGTSATDVYAVGNALVHYDGHTWTQLQVSESPWIIDVWTASSKTVYVVGLNSAVFRGQCAF